MNLHKLIMGDRWKELPAETVLDHKVSVFIGNTILVLMVTTAAGVITSSILANKLNDLKSKKD